MQDGDALAVRRQLEHVPAAIPRRDGLDPLGAVRAQVLAAEIAAVATHALLDGGGDLSVVERVAAPLRNELVGARQPHVHERLAACRDAAARHEDRGEAGMAMKLAGAGLPRCADDCGHGKAVARVFDRRREQVLERQAPEARVQLAPAIDRARHADGQRAALGDQVELEVELEQAFQRQRERRAAASVQAVQPAACGIPDDRKEVAADSAARRLREAERGIRGDRGIDGAAAAAQRREADFRRERLARRDHAAARRHYGARGETVGCGAVHGTF